MDSMERLFLFSLFLYLLSALLGVGSNRSESRFSLPASKYSYILATLITAVILMARLRQAGHWALNDFLDGILFSLVMVGLVYILSQSRKPIPFAPAALSVISIILGLLGVLKAGVEPDRVTPQIVSLAVHTYFMFTALAAFSLSFIFSLLYLYQEKALKDKNPESLKAKLPPLELTSRLNIASITLGGSALFMGVVAGWAHFRKIEAGWMALAEPSVLLTFLMLVLYLAIVFLRVGPLERARSVSYLSMICYVLLLFVFFGAH
jgi:ABC-type uncharacterized transport system permease subunit